MYVNYQCTNFSPTYKRWCLVPYRCSSNSVLSYLCKLPSFTD
uniref:Uncharacterized protein n=1 Tax=Rhizophora mucronata TaxID=61149 RepID=A0A2P2KWU4_RHIMU